MTSLFSKRHFHREDLMEKNKQTNKKSLGEVQKRDGMQKLSTRHSLKSAANEAEDPEQLGKL